MIEVGNDLKIIEKNVKGKKKNVKGKK